MRSIIIIYLFISSLQSFGQRLVKSHVPELKSLSLDSSYNWLDDIFGEQITTDVKFVGLGEFTHGGRETILFKSKMIQYLVREKGYRQVLLEYPNVALHPLNDYLKRKNSSNLDSATIIAQELFERTFLSNTSFYNLITWIKQYNLTHPDDTINLRGIDIEGASAGLADYFMQHYLLPIDRSHALEISSKWGTAIKDSLVMAEVDWFKKNRGMLEERLGKTAYQNLGYDVEAAEDKLTHDSLQKINIYKASAFRDSVMAAYTVAFGGPKSIIWSHNIHVTTSDYVVSLGNYLKKIIGNQYYSVLTDFSHNATVWSISNKGELSKKTYISNDKTVAYKLGKKQGIGQGVLFFDDLKASQTRVNYIDRAGNQMVFGRGHTFDALVVFNDVEPFMFR